MILFIENQEQGCYRAYFGTKEVPKGLQCAPKNGRKLRLRKKHTVFGEKISQEHDHQTDEIPDLENLH